LESIERLVTVQFLLLNKEGFRGGLNYLLNLYFSKEEVSGYRN